MFRCDILDEMTARNTTVRSAQHDRKECATPLRNTTVTRSQHDRRESFDKKLMTLVELILLYVIVLGFMKLKYVGPSNSRTRTRSLSPILVAEDYGRCNGIRSDGYRCQNDGVARPYYGFFCSYCWRKRCDHVMYTQAQTLRAVVA